MEQAIREAVRVANGQIAALTKELAATKQNNTAEIKKAVADATTEQQCQHASKMTEVKKQLQAAAIERKAAAMPEQGNSPNTSAR